MATADLTAQRLRELLRYEPETGHFFWLAYRRCGRHGWTHPDRPAGSKNVAGYLSIGIDGHDYLGHRLAWLYTYGGWPPFQIDHINRQPLDNRMCNLRQATQKQNCENVGLSKNNTSGYTGVYRLPNGTWNAKIKHNRKSINIGTFKTKELAFAARQEVEKRIFTHSTSLPQDGSP